MKTNNNFAYDLEVGQNGENIFADLLTGKKIEVKTDFQASRTGNLYVEFECWGKRSGLATTKADFWVFLIMKQGTNKSSFGLDEIEIIKFVSTNRLKTICREWLKHNEKIKGGDQKTAYGCLIKINDL